MISEKDLRIDNWVEIEGIIRQVTAQTIVAVAQCNLAGRHDFCKPIPLSPEILEKADFAKDESSNFSLTVSVYSNGKFTLKKSWSDYDPEWYAFTHLTNVRLYSLHQLQNLYYSLTGTELIINL